MEFIYWWCIFMKLFNKLLFIVISILSIYIALFGNIEQTLYKKLIVFSIIPVMLIPNVIEKIFDFKIDNSIKTLYLIFIFFAHFLGTIVNLYYKIEIYDKIMHTFSGVMTGFLGFIILVKSKKYNYKSIWYNILYIIAITCMVAVMWEMFEFTSDRIFNKDAQRVIKTGVNDTMIDMIVAFLGSCMVSLLYLYESKIKRNLIIKKFISSLK